MERKEWLQWRRSGIGSSDAPIIMGTSKFSTPLALWEEKISTEEIEEEQSFIMDLGNEAEPRIRSLFSLMTGKDFEVCLRESADFPFLRWSGDGLFENEGLEIKLAGKEVYQDANNKKVSDCYLPQVQHGIFVGNLKVMHYLVYPMDQYRKNRNEALDASLLMHVEVYPDKEYIARMLEAEIKFWDCVTSKKPPMAGDRDYKSLKGKTTLLKQWKKAKIAADKAEEKLEQVREQLIEEAKKQGHSRYLASGVRLREESRAGAVDYKSIPELKGVDLESYRKKGSTSWKIEIVEEA